MPKLNSNSFPAILISLLALLLFSCGTVQTEDDAIKQNQNGINFMNEGKYDSAIIEFKKAVKNSKLDRESKGTIYRNMALAYEEISDTDSSVHYYIIAAKSYYKNSYDYLVNMASVDIINGQTGAALRQIKKAYDINSEDLSVNNLLGIIYLGDYGEEFTDPAKALQFNKKAFEVGNSKSTEEVLARNYYDLENYELAEVHYENVYNKYSESATNLVNLGMSKFKLEKVNDAEALFKKALVKDSSYKETIEVFRDNNR